MARNQTTRCNLQAHVVALVLTLVPGQLARAQGGDESQGATPQPTVSDELAIQQGDLADQFGRLEKLMLRMAEFDQASNPRRAETLKRAYATAKEQDVRLQLESVVRLLNQDQYRRAITNQESALEDLRELLRVLESENRGDRLKDDQTRVREYIKEVERLQRMQRSVRGRTEGGLDQEQAAREQDQVARRAEALDAQIEQNEGQRRGRDREGAAASESDSGPKDQDDEPEDGEIGKDDEIGEDDLKLPDEVPSEDEPSEDQPMGDPQREGSGDASPPEGEPGEQGEPTEQGSEQGPPSQPGEPSQPGQPSSEPSGSGGGDSSESKPSEAFPGQQKIQQAHQQMQEAPRRWRKLNAIRLWTNRKKLPRGLPRRRRNWKKIRQMREEEIEAHSGSTRGAIPEDVGDAITGQ